jgi:histidinol-phosphate aminotransferase
MPKSEVRAMRAYCPPLEGRRNKLRLDFNENTVGCSPKVIQALHTIDANTLSSYPEYEAFYGKLASYLNVEPAQLALTNGTDEAIKIAMETFVQKGEEVVLPVPTYAMYAFYAQLGGLKLTLLPYEQDLTFPKQRILEALERKPRMLVLVNPNSPTSTPINDVELAAILKKAQEAGTLVLVDEAYYQYYQKTAIRKLSEYDNLLILQTFSKAFGLAALRLGYIVSNPSIIQSIRKANSPYSVNTLALVAASAALDDIPFVQAYADEVIRNREYLKMELEKLELMVYPSSANFLLVKLGARNNVLCKKLSQNNILIRNRGNDVLLDDCSRVGVGTRAQCDEFLSTLRMLLAKPLLLFDMDGVLVDVSTSYRRAIQQTVLFFSGEEPTLQKVQEYKQRGGLNNDWKTTQAILDDMGKKVSYEKMVAQFQSYYLGEEGRPGAIASERWLLDSVLLQKLYQNYTLAIFTGRPKAEAKMALEASGTASYFDLVVAMEDLPEEKSKPEPDGILLSLKQLGFAPEQAYYFGDSGDDMIAAQAAGVKAVGVLPPGVKTPELVALLREKGAIEILDSVNDIARVMR